MPDNPELIAVFETARHLVARPENDFLWSGWDDEEDAAREIDQILVQLREGAVVSSSMCLLFAPSGPLQEVSLSSGWGDDFVQLADRFDRAMAHCSCLDAPSTALKLVRELGMDRRFGEASVLQCPACSRFWLRYLYEVESISRSGRWYLGLVSAEVTASLTAEHAVETLDGLDGYFFGGSYFGGQVGRASGAVSL